MALKVLYKPFFSFFGKVKKFEAFGNVKKIHAIG